MREIKFRAWDKQNRRMFIPVEIIFDEETGKRLDVRESGGLSDNWRDAYLMQFTGLKDKNGKEIYEGDIVLMGENGSTYKVEWFGEDARFVLMIDNKPNLIPEAKWLKVIGNIYENLELLN